MTDLALALIKHFEGWRPRLYIDVAGHATIGYGHLVRPDERTYYLGRELSPREGEDLLLQDWAKHRSEVVTMASSVPVVMERELEALTSLCFNIGPGALRGSTAIRELKSGNRLGAAHAILMWRKAGGEVRSGLVRRRHLESIWFLGASPATLAYYAGI